MSFRGINALNLDGNGRLSIPTRYRDFIKESCQGKLVATVAIDDPCILIYPLPTWERIEKKIVNLTGFDAYTKKLQRLLVGHATDCQLDSQYRMLIPQMMRKLYKVSQKVVLLGQGKKLELWDEKRWHEEEATYLKGQESPSNHHLNITL